MNKSETELLLNGYRLITFEITYHMPDYPRVLNTFVHQLHDQAPRFPRMYKFLDFWSREIDGKIHSVRFDHEEVAVLAAQEWRNAIHLAHIH